MLNYYRMNIDLLRTSVESDSNYYEVSVEVVLIELVSNKRISVESGSIRPLDGTVDRASYHAMG